MTAEGIRKSALSRRGQAVSRERRDKISKSLRGRPSPVKGIPRTQKDREKISASLLLAYKEGRADATVHFKNKWHVYSGVHGTVNMRSQSEVLFAQKLDSYDIGWEYEPRRFDLGYTTYRPDFYLPSFDTYVEVKGWVNDESLRKMSDFRELGHRLVMTTYRQVREAGLPAELKEVSLHGI